MAQHIVPLRLGFFCPPIPSRSLVPLLITLTVGMTPILGLDAKSETAAHPPQCPGQQQTIELLQSRIKSDLESIQKLGMGITAADLEDATNVAESGRKAAMLKAALSLMDGFLMAPEAALGKQSVAEYQLRNGLGSIGTGQANALIARLKAQGGAKQALIPLIRELSQVTDKTSQLQYLERLSRAASSLKSTAELGASENSLEEAEALFGMAAAIAGKGDVAVSLANAIVNSAENETQIYLMAKSIDHLTNTAETQLKALNILSAKLKADVGTLESTRAAANCNNKNTPLTGQDYERERKKYVGAVEAAVTAFSTCVDKHQACVHSCDASEYPSRCYPQCGECKDTDILKAQKELDDFDHANNYGSPKVKQ